MFLDEGQGETQPGEGAGEAMDSPSDVGEGNPTTPDAPTDSKPQQKTNHNRVKLSDIMARLELLESRGTDKPAEKMPGSKVEVLSDAQETDKSASVSGTATGGTSEDEGSGAVSGPLDELSDTLSEVIKPFKGLRLGSWNYGRKPRE